MATIKITVTDGEDIYEKDAGVELTVSDISHKGYSVVENLCRVLKQEEVIE